MKLGRKPATFTARALRGAARMSAHLSPLGAPPAASNDYVAAVAAQSQGGWGTFLNDRIGDCVCADTAHTLMLRTANASSIVVPTDDDVLKLYEHFGYDPGDSSTDRGVNESDMCDYLGQTGFLGHKSDANARVDQTNLDHLKWSIQLFGSCRIGIYVTQGAMDQFSSGHPWDFDPSLDLTVLGGHDVPLVRYEGDTFYCVTWGALQEVTPSFLQHYCEEAHVELFADWIRSQGTAPPGLDMAALALDLIDLGPGT